jgi:mycothiol synthase
MPEITLRCSTIHDYTALARVLSAARPGLPVSPALLRYMDETRPVNARCERWLAADGYRVVGVSELVQPAESLHAESYAGIVAVHPDWQGQGIGSRLYARVERSLQELGGATLRIAVRETEEAGLWFLRNRGFHEERRYWEAQLDVSGADAAHLMRACEVFDLRGLSLRTAAELVHDPKRDIKLYDLVSEMRRDVPSPEAGSKTTLDTFINQVLHNPAVRPTAFFVAVLDEEYVGCSYLLEASDTCLMTGLTGVKRGHRRRGIATALKGAAIRYARDNGFRCIKAVNESGNLPMIALNEKLGFERSGAWIGMLKLFWVDYHCP